MEDEGEIIRGGIAMKYEEPQLELIQFIQDIITNSDDPIHEEEDDEIIEVF